MPITSPATSSPQLLEQPSRGFARLHSAGARSPFVRLVQHFLARLVRGDDSFTSGFDLGIGPLLGLLAAPGAFQCFLMLDKYSSLLNWLRGHLREDVLITSAPDKYLFLSIAMGIAGIVTALKWDRTLPDSQDYLNLAPLPIRPSAILFANCVAISIAVVVLSVTVNAASCLFFPVFVVASQPVASVGFAEFAAVHALCMILASLFAFGAVFAVLGVASAVLPRETFQACAPWLRGLLAVAFLALLLNGSAGPLWIDRLKLIPGSTVRLLPPVWFLGLYQTLQHRGTPELAGFARMAWEGIAIAFGLAILSYGFSYRHRFAGVLEGGQRPSEQRLRRAAVAFLDWFSYLRPGFARAGYGFIVRSLLRNEAQRFCLSASLAIGWLLAFQSAAPALAHGPLKAGVVPQLAVLGAPLVTAYLLLMGLRLAFEFPAVLPANWIFQSVLYPAGHDSLGICRRVMIAFVGALVLLPCLALSIWWGGVSFALLHTAYVFALCLCLIEVVLSGYRRIPFTSLMPGFRDSLPLYCLLQVLGFLAFSRIGAVLELWMLGRYARFLLLPAAMAAAWFWNQSRVRNAIAAGELEPGLSFENRPAPTVERLNLSDRE